MDRRSKEYKALKEERADALWKVTVSQDSRWLLPWLVALPVAYLACMLRQLCCVAVPTAAERLPQGRIRDVPYLC